MAAARLSVIVPVLNEAALIVAALTVLQPLRAEGVELIVVDGGSADGSAALAAPLADRVLNAPRGRAQQMNAGARVAVGAVLLFLHVDTSLPDGACAAVHAALEGSGRLWGRFDAAIDGRPPMLRVVAAMMNVRSRLTGIATGDQAIFVRREAFEAVDGYPRQALMEDIELSRRLLELSAPVCLPMKVVTSGRRWLAAGVWSTIVLMWWLRLLYSLGVPAARLAKAYR